MIHNPLLIVATLTILMASGCGPLVQIGGNAKPPTMLLTLHADAAPLPSPTRSDSLLITVPVAIGAVQTLRIPVTTRDTELQYLADANWSEQPNRLFRRVLVDTLASRGLTIIDPSGPAPHADRTLSGGLIDFGLDVRITAQPVVRVRYDAAISDSKTTRTRRFEASRPVADTSPSAVAAALNSAANAVAADVAKWVAP